MVIYPSGWKRTTMRGCGPDCQRKDLLVEFRNVSRTRTETRHVAPKGSDPAWVERCD